MQDNECDIAIVGGGIAGLYAAYRLRQAWMDRESQATLRERFRITGQTLRIVILEENPVELGGRVRTVRLPFPHGSVLAEVGPMRFTTRQKLLRRLLHDLHISTVPFRGDAFDKSYFLRGKHFRDADVKKGISPYNVRAADEKEKVPDDLVEMTFDVAIKNLSLRPDVPAEDLPRALLALERLRDKNLRTQLTKDEWDLIHEHGMLLGRVRLRDIGVWNLLHHYLSPEGAKLVEDGFGYESVIGNWNLSDAIPWFIDDFSPGQSYESVSGSFGELIRKLREKLEMKSRKVSCKIVQNIRVRRVDRRSSDGRYELKGTTSSRLYKNSNDFARTCSNPEAPLMESASIIASGVVLAIPKEPLLALKFGHLDEPNCNAQRREWRAKLHKVRSHRLAKLVQGYREAWWRTPESKKGAGALIITDLPLRQIYYWDEAWLTARGRYEFYDERGNVVHEHGDRQPEIRGLVVAYLDGHYTAYWRFITTVHRIRAGEAKKREDEEGFTLRDAKQLEKERCDCFGGRLWGWADPPDFIPREWSSIGALQRDPFQRPFDEWSTELQARYLYFWKHGLYERASTKMCHILEHLHESLDNGTRARMQPPVVGAYTFWDDFGDEPIPEAGWHTWEPGVDSEACMEEMTHPFAEQHIFICGEAYSSEQGWSEGALKSVERLMHELGVDLGDEIRKHVGVKKRDAKKNS